MEITKKQIGITSVIALLIGTAALLYFKPWKKNQPAPAKEGDGGSGGGGGMNPNDPLNNATAPIIVQHQIIPIPLNITPAPAPHLIHKTPHTNSPILPPTGTLIINSPTLAPPAAGSGKTYGAAGNQGKITYRAADGNNVETATDGFYP